MIKKLMMNYTNLSTILNCNEQSTTDKLNILKINECVSLEYYKYMMSLNKITNILIIIIHIYY